MNKAQLWQDIIKNHPEWLTAGAHLSPERLKVFFDLEWDEAVELRQYFGGSDKETENRVRRTLGV